MALSTQPYKGARDFYPHDKRLLKYIFSKWRGVVESFGYEEYDAPLLEPLELYKAKTGEEIVNEQTYTFVDRGDRHVVIRPEMTPSVARMVAGQRQELSYPVRWYSIPNLWRYERPQRGRLREHWQLNVDLFGVSGLEAEHEMVLMADAIMQAFGASRDGYIVRLNSRKLIETIMQDYLGLDPVQNHSLSKLLDHMHKMDRAEFEADAEALFTPSQREAGKPQQLFQLLKISTLEHLPGPLKENPSVAHLEKLLELLKDSHMTNVVFDISLMRGFDYYTDIVFEVFDTHPDNNRSLFGGGRYDGLVGIFGVEDLPTVGFGMGDVTLLNFMEAHQLLPKLPSETDLYIVLVGDVYETAQKPIAELRQMGVNVFVDSTMRKVDKQIKSAVKKDIPYVLFLGEAELEADSFTLRNLEAKTEEKHSLQRIVSIVKDHRG